MENINTLVIHQKLKLGLPYYTEIQFLDKDKLKKKLKPGTSAIVQWLFH